jgi:hypothetical protein
LTPRKDSNLHSSITVTCFEDKAGTRGFTVPIYFKNIL